MSTAPHLDADHKAANRPFCFSCGYDLFGLELPHPCPECGQLADPERQADQARRWFASRRAWFWLFTRSSKIPPGLLYSLHDSASIRLARKRLILGVILPALLCSFIVFVGSMIGIEKRYKVWYYDSADPDRTPLRVSFETKVDHLYNFNFHFFDSFFSPPAFWVQLWEPLPGRSLTFVWPPSFDSFTFGCAVGQWAIFLFGCVPCWFILMNFGRRASLRESTPGMKISLRSVLVLPCIGGAAMIWSWISLIIFSGTLDIIGESPILTPVIDVVRFILVGIAGAGILGSMVVWPRLVYRDRAGRLFRSPALLAILLVLTTLGGQASFFWLMFIYF